MHSSDRKILNSNISQIGNHHSIDSRDPKWLLNLKKNSDYTREYH